MRADCPELFPFADPGDLIAFFHDQAADLDRKDAILFEIVARYRTTTGIATSPRFSLSFLLRLWRASTPLPGGDIPQSTGRISFRTSAFFSSRLSRKAQSPPFKVAGRIVGELKNHVRGLLGLIPAEVFIVIKGDGTDAFEVSHDFVSDDEAGDFVERIREEITTFLDRLLRAGKISRKDRRILLETFIGGKSLKDLASARDYERLKHRRRQVMEYIKNILQVIDFI
jgi:hypothetical protein